jgi:hypothetical protein
MNETILTLNNLFDFSDAALRTQLSQVVGATSTAARLAAKNLHFSKESIAEEITRKVASLCAVDVIELLGEAWNKEREIEECMEKGLRTSGETAFVSLLEHTVKSTWRFVIEIIVRPLAYKIHVDLNTALTLKGGKLKIEDGKITELISGTIGGKVTISIESAEIWKQECKPVDLLPMRLGKPIKTEQSLAQKVAG